MVTPESEERFLEDQKATFQFFIESGQWLKITKQNLPLIPQEQLEFYSKVAQAQREKLILAEMDELPQIFQRLRTDAAKQTLAGRLHQLQDELDSIVLTRYAETKPQAIDEFGEQMTFLSFNRDTAAGISFLRDAGDLNALTVENIPQLKLLSPIARVNLQLTAGVIAFHAVEGIKRETIGEKARAIGFLGENGTASISPIDQFADRQMYQIAERMFDIAREGLQYVPEIPKKE